MLLPDLAAALGYTASPLYGEIGAETLVGLSDRHWVRDARKAGAKGTYFFRTSPEPQALRPAVHIAEAGTIAEAREIHRKLWNQAVNPFLIVLLPAQVRVYTGFAYNPDVPETGAVTPPISTSAGMAHVIEALSWFTADAINRGDIWERNAMHLGAEQRVDTTLLKNLRSLAQKLECEHALPLRTCHALIGKFVYLAYLRARDILSDKWLRDEAAVDPEHLFKKDVFAPTVTLGGFRRLVRALEKRFNGKLFPIPWGSKHAPKLDAIRTVARVFAGDEIEGQLHLPFRAYDFASIPVEFLSAIYEQFLHSETSTKATELVQSEIAEENAASNPEKRGAHYTPEPLAEYVISEIASVCPLRLGMRILDPCCGSGIFLVIAYRRLVELKCVEENRGTLNPSELRNLLVTSIYAVERNPIACQIAAFSLVLAMLGYVEPPELHRQKNFKFPTLVGSNLFAEDFFDENGCFWKRIVSPVGLAIAFDWIVGNPPWVELDKNRPEAALLLRWAKVHQSDFSMARARTGEAFAWRVTECLSETGAVGLVLHAKTLTNDQLYGWRKQFFSRMSVRRVTNFANLAYIIFASAETPCVTLIFTLRQSDEMPSPILHLGPFVANQSFSNVQRGAKRRAWSIGFSESEIRNIAVLDAQQGLASTWKFALWGNERDFHALRRLKAVFSTTLGEIATQHGWSIELGLQLRKNAGTRDDPAEEVQSLSGVAVLDHKALPKFGKKLVVPGAALRKNEHGEYVRKRGGNAGLNVMRAPHLLLRSEYAAFSERDFIIRNPKVGLAGGDASQMKAVAAIWTSSFTGYLLFFLLSSEWGIDRNQIDKGDAEKLPFPKLTSERQVELCNAWEEAAALETNGGDFRAVKALLDVRVAAAIGLSPAVVLVVCEFFRVRYQLNKGKSPPKLRQSPDETELTAYASRLQVELDSYLAGKAHHRILVLHSSKGICASITITREKRPTLAEVRAAANADLETLEAILRAAEIQFNQWVYVKRSIRLFDGNTIHLVKPPRRLEWTETQAMIDADDIINEALEERQRVPV